MTDPGLAEWPFSDPGYRRSEISAVIGQGDDVWARASQDVRGWRVKTASGFSVDPASAVSVGDRPTITVNLGWVEVREPVEVTAVVVTANRVGFAYRTLPGHPVSGEEAFIVHRDSGKVLLTVRSLTKAAAEQPWRALFPLLRVAQLLARRRYLRALS